jgi:ribonucleoside-diphosphate reductase alpha chain
MTEPPFTTEVSRFIWETKYRYPGNHAPSDGRIDASWRRVARALAEVEPKGRDHWAGRFHALMRGFRFIPGGRILAGAGSGRRVTLFNCFVMGPIEDSMDGIFEALKEGALTMQQGGGIGYDFSTLRPRGTLARSVGGIASGPVSFMRIWDSMCATLLSTGNRRGAMMATLRCDHPDIEAFVEAKRDPRELRHFNLSVQVSDAFMAAVHEDRDWPLVFPAERLGDGARDLPVVLRRWPGSQGEIPCRVLRRVRARGLWDRIMHATYEVAEPGVLFVDRINRTDNLWYREYLSATNPCGEIPLPPYGACDLGSINLTRFVREPFTPEARLDLDAVAQTAEVATRLLDDVIDASRFPLRAQAEQARATRRIGLGITGLADALIMLGLRYDEDAAYALAARTMRRICHAAYRSSIALAKEKGAFPALDRVHYLEGPFVRALPQDIHEGIAQHGIRNSHLLAIAPAGTISLLANNVSSGLEPVFDFHYTRKVLDSDGGTRSFQLEDPAWRAWRERHPEADLPPQFVAARELTPQAHLRMQAALQPCVDNAISKTINVPEGLGFEAFKSLYEEAYGLGLKGCTTFRPNPVSGAVLHSDPQRGADAAKCCSV